MFSHSYLAAQTYSNLCNHLDFPLTGEGVGLCPCSLIWMVSNHSSCSFILILIVSKTPSWWESCRRFWQSWSYHSLEGWMQWATWVGVQAKLEIPWFLCKQRRKTKPFSLSNSKLYVQPWINIFLWCQGQSLWRKDHYFNSTSAGGEKGLLENKPTQKVFPVPQKCLSLYNKQLIDSFSWNAWIDSISKADFSSRVTIFWK